MLKQLSDSVNHNDPIAGILLSLVILLVGAQVGGYLAQKFRQPAVLGELAMGILLGNLGLIGIGGGEVLAGDPVISVFASIGVILLLFEVGLDSHLEVLLGVGRASLLVAVVGVVCPFGLGYLVSSVFYPEKLFFAHVFTGAILSATSVGITARVLKDLGKLGSKEAQIVLGAAVMDDVLGLILLAVVSGMITSAGASGVVSQTLDWISVGWICIKAVGFLILALWGGGKLAPVFFRFGGQLKVDGLLLTMTLCFCFVMATVASLVGLAPIVGAFAAGLVLDSRGLGRLFPGEERSVEDLIFPLSKVFVPIFFVHMGMKVDLAAFSNGSVLGFGLMLSLVAIIGKQACGLVVGGRENQGVSRLMIGIGMIPRGEVGLIFAAIGSNLILNGAPVVDGPSFSAVVMMVVVTTLITPPALTWASNRV